jgi:hypothetical protein
MALVYTSQRPLLLPLFAASEMDYALAETTTNFESTDPIKDGHLYRDGGDTVILVENVLFRVCLPIS